MGNMGPDKIADVRMIAQMFRDYACAPDAARRCLNAFGVQLIGDGPCRLSSGVRLKETLHNLDCLLIVQL